MDYIREFFGAITLAYCTWVAQQWWVGNKEGLHFQRRVWWALAAASAVWAIYNYGVLQGAHAALQDLLGVARLEDIQRHIDPDAPHRHTHFEDITLPNWMAFYLSILWIEISFATTMPQRKRPNGQSGVEQQRPEEKRPGANPDGMG